MNIPSLLLCPADPSWIPPDGRPLHAVLQRLQFIGQALDHAGHYLAGDKFLDMIAFMGCSPDIRLEPAKDADPFCFIELEQHTPAVAFRHGEHTHTPRCPLCRTPMDDWKTRIKQWPDTGTGDLWQCDACGNQAPPWEYNWRKTASFGKCFIAVRNIFPREAIPQPVFLDTLHSYYGVEWHYFYQY